MGVFQKRGIVNCGIYEPISILEADKIILNNIKKYVNTDDVCNVGKWIAEAFIYDDLPYELSQTSYNDKVLYIPNADIFNIGIHLYKLVCSVFNIDPDDLDKAVGAALLAGSYYDDDENMLWYRPSTKSVWCAYNLK